MVVQRATRRGQLTLDRFWGALGRAGGACDCREVPWWEPIKGIPASPHPRREQYGLTSDQSRAAHSGGQAGPWQASRTGGRGCGHALSSSAFSSAADTRRWHTTERLRTPASQLRLQRDQFPTTQLRGGAGLRECAGEGRPSGGGSRHILLLPRSQHLGGIPHRAASAGSTPAHPWDIPTLHPRWGWEVRHAEGEPPPLPGEHCHPDPGALPTLALVTPRLQEAPRVQPRRALTLAGKAPCCRRAASWGACCGRCNGGGPPPSCPADCGTPRPAPGCLGGGRETRSAPPGPAAAPRGPVPTPDRTPTSPPAHWAEHLVQGT